MVAEKVKFLHMQEDQHIIGISERDGQIIMTEVTIRDEYIKLEQAMKLCGACGSGSEAKYEIQDGHVTVNGEQELRRGRKLRDGDEFTFSGKTYKVTSRA